MKRGAPLLIPAAGVLWGILGIFVRRLNESGLASMDIVWIRAAVTTLVLLPILFLRRKGEWRIRLRDLRCFLGTGIGSIVFFNFCYFQAVTITSLSVAAVLLYTAPAFVIVLSALFFKEKITGGKIAALLLTLFGLMLVTGMIGSGTRLSLQGLLFGLGAGLGYALYSIFGRFAIQRGYRPLTITFYTFLVAAVASAFLTGCSLCPVHDRAAARGERRGLDHGLYRASHLHSGRRSALWRGALACKPGRRCPGSCGGCARQPPGAEQAMMKWRA